MKKQILILRMIVGFFVLFFSSCINHDYDLTDENLDKNIVFSPDGVNVPIGNLDSILIGNELRKLYDDDSNEDFRIKTDAGGTFFIEYKGRFDVTFPEIEVPEFEPFTPDATDIQMPDIPIINGRVTIPPIKFSIVPDTQTDDKITKPSFKTETEGLTVSLEQIYFKPGAYSLDLAVNLTGITFTQGGKADLNLYLIFPSNFTFKAGTGEKTSDGKTRISQKISIDKLLKDGSAAIPNIAEISSYTYDEEIGFLYGVELDIQEAITVTGIASPKFKMTLSVNNKPDMVEYVSGYAEGREVIGENEDGAVDIGNFTDAFGESILHFKNPSLQIDLETNLACSFDLDVDMFTLDANGGTIGNVELDGLAFDAPGPDKAYPETKTTSYHLSPVKENVPDNITWKEFKLNNIFEKTPDALDYKIYANFNTPVTLYPEGLVLSTDYTIKLPFDFENLQLKISDKIENLFSEDLYDQLFDYAKGNIKIEADNVDVQLGSMKLKVTARILDGNSKEIGINPKEMTLESGANNQGKFSIEITDADKAKMINARHLEFDFEVDGAGAIKESDYIRIQKIRIISDAGIHYELDF